MIYIYTIIVLKYNNTTKDRSQRTITFRSFSKLKDVGSLCSNDKAEKLDMDHVYIPFLHFLWARFFIGVNATYFWVKEVILLLIRKKLLKLKYIQPKPFDPKKVVGKLCLEGELIT